MAPSRAPRYAPVERPGMLVLGPRQVEILTWLLHVRLLSTAQLAALLACSEKALRRAVRPLFDGGLVEIVAVPRAALAAGDEANDHRLLFGSAPNLYRLSSAGADLLVEYGIATERPRRSSLGPKNSWFLRHELACSDLRVWVEQVVRSTPGAQVALYRSAPDTAIPLGTGAAKVLRPDAIFGLALGERVMVALCEVDLATEGPGRWKDKLSAYARAFSGDRLKQAIGYQRGRLLILTTPKRLQPLATIIAELAPKELRPHSWMADMSVLTCPDLTRAHWTRPGTSGLVPLVPAIHSDAPCSSAPHVADGPGRGVCLTRSRP